MSFHERFDREIETKGSSERSFGLLFAAVFALMAVYAYWIGSDKFWIWLISTLIVLLVAFLWSNLLRPLDRAWMQLGLLLFHVISPVFIALLYYVCVTPIGVLRRVLGRDSLSRGFDSNVSSYWIERSRDTGERSDMRNQF